jgi:hypothetical protein
VTFKLLLQQPGAFELIKQTVRKVGLSGVAGGINRHRGL